MLPGNLADSFANATGDEKFYSGDLRLLLQLFHVRGAGLSKLVLGSVEAGTVHVIVDLCRAIGEHRERDVVECSRVERKLVRCGKRNELIERLRPAIGSGASL